MDLIKKMMQVSSDGFDKEESDKDYQLAFILIKDKEDMEKERQIQLEGPIQEFVQR